MVRRPILWITALACAAWLAPFLLGGDGEEPPRRRGGDRWSRGRTDPEEWRKRMEEYRRRASEQLKAALEATDEQWVVLEPRIEAVRTAQAECMGPRGGFVAFFGPRPPGSEAKKGPREDPPPQSEVEKRMRALRELLHEKDTTPAQVTESLTALREVRKEAERKLAEARNTMREGLKPRQEAMLVMMGLLD